MTFMKFQGHPKVIKGQLVMPYGFQTLSEELLIQIRENFVLNKSVVVMESMDVNMCMKWL